MDNKKSYSKETQELFDAATKALHLAGLEARKVAIQTNTNLVIYDPEKGVQEIPPSQLKKELGMIE